jgi:hypothetical protein
MPAAFNDSVFLDSRFCQILLRLNVRFGSFAT